jgi:hypothetical protein
MSAMKRCSRCRKNKSTDDYGYKKNNTEYKTCLTCRDKSSYSSSPSLYLNCLGGCVNPSAGLHHFRCPNYVAPPNFDNVRRANEEVAKKELSRDVMKNGASSSEDSHRISTIIYLITFPEIVRTFEGYGYKVYTMEDIKPLYWDKRDFKDIAIKIANSKSVFLMYLSIPLTQKMHRICRSIFDMDIDMDDKPPSLLLGISYYNKHSYGEINISFLPCRNLFKNYVVDEKLKNRRRCEICNLKKKCYRICGQCKGKVCIECYNKMNSCTLAPCPYCRYSFNDHVDKELKYI